jgi:hypothetical protein
MPAGMNSSQPTKQRALASPAMQTNAARATRSRSGDPLMLADRSGPMLPVPAAVTTSSG